MEVQLLTSRFARFTPVGRSPVPIADEVVLAQRQCGRVCYECSPNISHFVPLDSSKHVQQVDLTQRADVHVRPPQTEVQLWKLMKGTSLLCVEIYDALFSSSTFVHMSCNDKQCLY
jgi:hypothetical protein